MLSKAACVCTQPLPAATAPRAQEAASRTKTRGSHDQSRSQQQSRRPGGEHQGLGAVAAPLPPTAAAATRRAHRPLCPACSAAQRLMEFLRERADRAWGLPPEEASEDSAAVAAAFDDLAAAEAALCERGADGRLQPRRGGPASLLAGIKALAHILRYIEATHVPCVPVPLTLAMIPLCEASALRGADAASCMARLSALPSPCCVCCSCPSNPPLPLCPPQPALVSTGPDTFRFAPAVYDSTLPLTALNIIKMLVVCSLYLNSASPDISHKRTARAACTNLVRHLAADVEGAAYIAGALAATGVWPGCTPAALRRSAATLGFYAANLAAGEAAAKAGSHCKPAEEAEQAVELARELVALAPASPRPQYLLACAYQDYDSARQGAALREALRLAEASNCAWPGALHSSWAAAHGQQAVVGRPKSNSLSRTPTPRPPLQAASTPAWRASSWRTGRWTRRRGATRWKKCRGWWTAGRSTTSSARWLGAAREPPGMRRGVLPPACTNPPSLHK